MYLMESCIIPTHIRDFILTISKLKSIKLKDGTETIGFNDLSVVKNYIYLSWHRSDDDEDNERYIYRISTDGKQVQKLAKGAFPVIYNNRINYAVMKPYEDFDGYVIHHYCSIALDGSDKKRIEEPKYQYLKSSPATGDDIAIDEKEDSDWIVTTYSNQEEATSGNYYYYTKDDYRYVMCRNLKTGKENVVYECKDKYELFDFYVHKQYVLMNYYDRDNKIFHYYFVRQDGKNPIEINKYKD